MSHRISPHTETLNNRKCMDNTTARKILSLGTTNSQTLIRHPYINKTSLVESAVKSNYARVIAEGSKLTSKFFLLMLVNHYVRVRMFRENT